MDNSFPEVVVSLQELHKTFNTPGPDGFMLWFYITFFEDSHIDSAWWMFQDTSTHSFIKSVPFSFFQGWESTQRP